ncbi:MAG TPA: ATP-dependent RNA helicase RhlB, partial [Xanthomonadaceae bacterium]|nr:ATP-dependent RNA helicase RhlB [Xanthomonadaceae bacterium]
RRGGKRVAEDAARAAPQRETAPPPSRVPASRQSPAPAPAAKPSLLSRLGRGLKSLVTRSPSSQH